MKLSSIGLVVMGFFLAMVAGWIHHARESRVEVDIEPVFDPYGLCPRPSCLVRTNPDAQCRVRVADGDRILAQYEVAVACEQVWTIQVADDVTEVRR